MMESIGETYVRSSVRKLLFEFFDRISALIDQNLGTDVSYEYTYPKGLNRKSLEGFYDLSMKIMDIDDDQQWSKIEKKTERMVKAFAKLNPELRILKDYLSYEPWLVFNGIISGYSPKDILFFITHPGGYANRSIRNYTRDVSHIFGKFPFKYPGGYLPSPESFEKIKKAMKEKGLDESVMLS